MAPRTFYLFLFIITFWLSPFCRADEIKNVPEEKSIKPQKDKKSKSTPGESSQPERNPKTKEGTKTIEKPQSKEIDQKEKSPSTKKANNTNSDQKTKPYPWEKLYKKALKYYDKKKYSRAADLFFEIIPVVSTQKDIIEIRYKLACSSFYSKDYSASIYQFEEIFNDYPKSKYSEEALYMHAKSLFKKSPRIELNQDYTEEALLAINYYLELYPSGKFHEEALKDKIEIESKLFNREYYISNTYYDLEKYDAAIIQISPMIEHPPSEEHLIIAKIFKLKCLYMKALAQKKNFKKRELLVEASEAIIFLQDEHKLSKKHNKEINKLNKKINKHLSKL